MAFDAIDLRHTEGVAFDAIDLTHSKQAEAEYVDVVDCTVKTTDR